MINPLDHRSISNLILLGILTLIAVPLGAQTIIQGKTILEGVVGVGSPFSHNVQIMAVFPPAIGSNDYSSFYSNVMTQPSVDGVTVEIIWSTVEKNIPTSPPCPAQDDTHQTDAVGMCHTYDWTSYENTTSATGMWTWFSPFLVNGVSRQKKVNLLLFGIAGSNTNIFTPWYVTSSGYVSNFQSPYNRQDVINAIKDCVGVPWTGIAASASVTFTRSGTTVTVDSLGCCKQTSTTMHDQDTIYVSSATTNFQTLTGKPATRVNDDSFTYQVANIGPTGCTDCVYMSQGWSSPVPYEKAYTAAWQAFVAAAIRHFNSNYQANGVTVGAAGSNQLGYIRAGTWVGGESFVYCTSGGASGGLQALAPPYQYPTDSSLWLSDFQNKVLYVQSLSPQTYIFWPINLVGTDYSYPNTEAQYANAASNAFGLVNGFGSQGLSLLDFTSGPCSTGTSASNWCYLFGNYYLENSPSELQQIAISDPTNTSCPVHTCGVPPAVAGDLRVWLPYAVSNHVTVVEMYYRDLGLAFDVNYCTAQSGGACTAGYTVQNNSNVTTTQEWQWFSAGNGGTLVHGVGQGSNCPSSPGGIGAGDCSYADAINAAHGLH